MREINSFSYKDFSLDILNHCERSHASCTPELNGVRVEHTLQIPEGRLQPGKNTISVKSELEPPSAPLLLCSTVRLVDVFESNDGVLYEIEAFGFSAFTFARPANGSLLFSLNPAEADLEQLKIHEGTDHYVVEFWLRGRATAKVICQQD